MFTLLTISIQTHLAVRKQSETIEFLNLHFLVVFSECWRNYGGS